MTPSVPLHSGDCHARRGGGGEATGGDVCWGLGGSLTEKFACVFVASFITQQTKVQR